MSSAITSTTTLKPATCSRPKACAQSKWFAIALIVSSIVLFGGAALFGGFGMFLSPAQMPFWMNQVVGTVGFWCMGMLIGGSLLAASGTLCGAALLVTSKK